MQEAICSKFKQTNNLLLKTGLNLEKEFRIATERNLFVGFQQSAQSQNANLKLGQAKNKGTYFHVKRQRFKWNFQLKFTAVANVHLAVTTLQPANFQRVAYLEMKPQMKYRTGDSGSRPFYMEGGCLGYPGRANFSYVSFKNASKRLHARQGSRLPGLPCLLARGTRLGGVAFYHVNGSCRLSRLTEAR